MFSPTCACGYLRACESLRLSSHPSCLSPLHHTHWQLTVAYSFQGRKPSGSLQATSSLLLGGSLLFLLIWPFIFLVSFFFFFFMRGKVDPCLSYWKSPFCIPMEKCNKNLFGKKCCCSSIESLPFTQQHSPKSLSFLLNCWIKNQEVLFYVANIIFLSYVNKISMHEHLYFPLLLKPYNLVFGEFI